jgi:hypothetical protein
MGRGLLALLALAGVAALFGGSQAAAAPGVDTQVLGSTDPLILDPLQEEAQLDALSPTASNNTKQVGPVPSTSPDSGTCGNDWAQDSFDRVYKITASPDGTHFRVAELFKNGTFTTMNGPSPGACDETDGTPPGMITAGFTGNMHGHLIVDVTCISPACTPVPPSCSPNPAPCQTTLGFLTTFFPGGVYDYSAFSFHYGGLDGFSSVLAVNEWKNASPNRGCNHGDVAAFNVGVTPPFLNALCP